MRIIGANEYECDPNEQIDIDFTAFPNRKNVGISRSWNEENPVEIKGNSITKKMEGDVMTLTLFFVFVTNGSCDLTILGSSGGDQDTDTATSMSDEKDYIFRRVIN